MSKVWMRKVDAQLFEYRSGGTYTKALYIEKSGDNFFYFFCNDINPKDYIDLGEL